MTDKTMLDELFAPVLPSLKVLFLRYKKSTLLARHYVELEQVAEVRRQYHEAMKILSKQHKETRKKLDDVCFKLRGLDHG